MHHDGWVLKVLVGGQDGYAQWRDRWGEMSQNPDRHPGNRGIAPIISLTGRLRSSGYHDWPYQVAQTPEESHLWDAWRGKREAYEAALAEALQTGQPISDPPGIHPERSRLNYPYTGLTVGRLMESLATGRPNVIPLQVPNRGAITNFPDEAIVEVPTLVQGHAVQPQPVGEMPEWLGGYTRLLAVQRCLIVEYVLERRLETLKQALATLPMFGTVQQLNAYAEALHEEYTVGASDAYYTQCTFLHGSPGALPPGLPTDPASPDPAG